MEAPTIDWRACALDLDQQLAALRRQMEQQRTAAIQISTAIPLDYADQPMDSEQIVDGIRLCKRMIRRLERIVADLQTKQLCLLVAAARAAGEDYTDSSEDTAVGP